MPAILGGWLHRAQGRLSSWIVAVVATLLVVARSRAVAVDAAGRVFASSRLLGTGFATFGEIYSRFMPQETVTQLAHNDYAHLLAEAGIAGGLIGVGFFGFLGIRLGQLATPGD